MSGVDFAGGVIEENVRCTHCGYNLRGLVRGGRCPECGTVSRVSRSATYGHIPMVDVSKRYLNLLSVGLALMSMSGALLFGSIVLIVFPGLSVPFEVFVVALAGGVTVWPLGVLLALVPRPVKQNDGAGVLGREWLVLRGMVGVTQVAGPVLMAGLSVMGAATGLQFLGGMAMGLGIVVMLGLVPLCLYLGELAWWGDDNRTQEWLRTAAWAIGLGTIGAAGCLGLLKVSGFGPFAVVGILLLGVVLFGAGIVVFSSFGLWSTVRWAVRNQESLRARDARMAEKQRREEEERMARLAHAPQVTAEEEALAREVLARDQGGEPGRDPASGASAHRHAQQGLVIDRTGEEDIYSLEEDGEGGSGGRPK